MGAEESKYRVFVSNLNPNTSDDEFVSYFQFHYGGVEGAKIIRDSNGRSKEYGFISFVNSSFFDQVVSQKYHTINGTRVVCKIASPRKTNQNITKNNAAPKHLKEIYIGNLDTNTTLQQMKDYFSYFGEVEHAFIVSDENQRSLGYGFIEFQNPSSVDLVQEQRPHSINERQLQISRSYPRHVPTRLKKPSNVLYVANYDDRVDESNIEEYFTQYGDIIYVSRTKKRQQDNVRLMEVHFDDYDAVDVICLADNHTINGCTITVSKYLEYNNLEKLQNQQQANVSTSNLPQKLEGIHQQYQHVRHDLADFGNQVKNLYPSASTHLHRQDDPKNDNNDCVIL
ncbi:heterogeneous nuclear ribonucleoprotein A1, A2/B1 homolog [Planococcus citri]|uniref:heterogeneous nuclear ribonucleoprotein A1, A2/B1 homolog n=1 Tax=Planococcus citri TaxID=170843 RepID=UPI0031F98DAF